MNHSKWPICFLRTIRIIFNRVLQAIINRLLQDYNKLWIWSLRWTWGACLETSFWLVTSATVKSCQWWTVYFLKNRLQIIIIINCFKHARHLVKYKRDLSLANKWRTKKKARPKFWPTRSASISWVIILFTKWQLIGLLSNLTIIMLRYIRSSIHSIRVAVRV